MKKIQQYIFFIFLIIPFTKIAAQQQKYPVHFTNGDYFFDHNISNNSFTTAAINYAIFENDYFVIIQFSELPTADLKEKMFNDGIRLHGYLPENSYLAAISTSFDFTKAKNFHISSINTLPSFYKIDRRLEQFKLNFQKETTTALAISCIEVADKKTITTALKNVGAIIVSTKLEAANIFLVQVNTAIINQLAALPFISSIHLQTIKDVALNYNSRASNGVAALNAFNGKNLNGKGVAIGIGDNADISTHIDFSDRLINRSPWSPQDHGTHTSGTAAGAGILNIKNRGMASKATIINQYFSDIITNAPTYISDYNMVLSNNSYYASAYGCPGEGEYNGLSIFADQQIIINNQLLHVIAAGNDGELVCSPYSGGFGTVKTGWQTAKNVLTVGAIKTSDYTNASYSSKGPLLDGRIKPEVMADGFAVVSTYPYNTYGFNYGTSMAAPAATGSLALMYERYRQKNSGANPKSALMKALLCNTAEDLGNPGPDFTYGFGMINTRRAVEAIDSNRYIINSVTNGNNATHNIVVPANTRRVKIMLYWADQPAANNAAAALVNDLDMIVVEPSFILHRPLILNPNPASVNNNAVEAPDHINNVEQVVIENPAAGIYTVNVNGYSIPFGPQEYVLTYEIIKTGVTVEYPYGGETWVPGETENIRWNAYGNDANNFTIEYSSNNGNSWTSIDNNVASTQRVYVWTVPASATNAALIRVSRNGTALSGQSNLNFSILDQPIISAYKICEGAVLLNWPVITNANSYDILQLVNDSMKLIGNSASNNYIITGLDKNKTYWFAVAAKNNTVAGRRSLSVNIKPDGGPCTLAAFNNDVKVDSILEPNTARQFFSNAGNASKPVKILIKNLSTATVNGPFNVFYNFDNGPVISEILNTAINAGGTVEYTFSGSYPFVAAGYQYNFKSWVTLTADANHLNDIAYKKVKYINNDAILILPLTENFESMPAIELQQKEMGIAGNKYLDFSASGSKGRLRTFVNTGMAFGGSKALTLDQMPYDLNNTADSAVFNYNLTLFNNKQLRFDFYFKNHGQIDAAGNRVWIRGTENDNWIEAYNLFGNQAGIGKWKKAIININDLLTNASPSQNTSATFQIKLGQEGNTTANSINPIVDLDDGYSFDNLNLSEAINDVALVNIISPDKGGCGLNATNQVSVKIKNYNNSVLNNLLVSYQINGGSIITENIPTIGANQSLDFVFAQTANLSAYIDYNINAWVKYAADNYSANDSILNYLVHNSPIISTYPYLQDFENNNGNFYTSGTNNSWQWGTPSGNVINKAANGSKAWVTNVSGNYNDNETSYLISPCFNLTGLQKPVLSFSHIFDIEQDYDYTWVEYTIDGKTWQKLGTVNSGTNWYDNTDLINWRLSKTNWHVASIDIPVTNTTIRFRFVMSSDGGLTMEGVGIDDVRVHEKVDIHPGPGFLFPVTINNNNWPNGWVPFNNGDPVLGPWYILGEINTNGQNLGAVTIEPYLNFNIPVRNSGNQYYLDKSFVIKSSIAPQGPVGVRLYFSDAQANELINATGCPGCGKPTDAYELGITKYRGSPAEENGTLEDNFSGFYQFITPVNTLIMPHGNGYYAEFTVNDFSEFYFSKNIITPIASSNCPATTITYTVASGATSYQWQENNGNGYTNIIDGAGYSGATTNMLQLINPPTSFTGYQYRCVVNGNNGYENILRFKNIWNGNTSNNWFTASNWSCGTVPDNNTDVIIPNGLSRYPILTASTSIRSIRILTNVPVVINAGVNLNVLGK